MAVAPYIKGPPPADQQSQVLYLEKELKKIQTAFQGLVGSNPWATYAPVVTAGAGAITAYTASGRYNQIGKLVFVQIDVTVTTNGTGAGDVIVTLPVAAQGASVLHGREVSVGGKMLQGQVAGTVVLVYNYDNTYPAGNGYRLVLSGSYEAA